MNIDRNRICSVFTEYTDRYNSADTKIKLKIDHTFRVAGLSQQIADSLRLCEDDVNIAWLIGMLHDVGRFEQVRRYNTFSDADSIDHAQFGADLLFKEGLLESYLGKSCEEAVAEGIVDEDTLGIIELAIRNHSAYRVQEGLTDRQLMFCNIIRDADKIDILRVNTELPLEEIYNVTTKELKEASITKEVLEAFYEEHAVLRSLKKAPVDNVVGHISLCYELVFNVSFDIVKQQGWIYRLLDFQSDNAETAVKMAEIREHMLKYLEKKITEIR